MTKTINNRLSYGWLSMALTLSALSGTFNIAGGYLLGSFVSPTFGYFLGGMAAILELVVFFLPSASGILAQNWLLRWAGKIPYIISIAGLTFSMFTGINKTATTTALALGSNSSASTDVAIANVRLTGLIAEEKRMREEFSTAVTVLSPEAIRKLRSLERQMQGASCPSHKWRTICGRIEGIRAQQKPIISTEDRSRRAKKIAESISMARVETLNLARIEKKAKNKANVARGIFFFTPVGWRDSEFAAVLSFSLAVLLEIVKYLVVYIYWSLRIGGAPSSSQSSKSRENTRMTPYGAIRSGLVWFIRYRVRREVIVTEKAATKLAEAQMAKDDSNAPLSTKVVDIEEILRHITIKQLEGIVDRNGLPTDSHSASSARIMEVLRMVISNHYVAGGKFIPNAITKELKETSPWVTYPMLRTWVAPILAKDLALIEKDGRSYKWVTKWDAQKRIYTNIKKAA